MDSIQLNRRVIGLLGFRVTERKNDAIVELFEPLSELEPPKVRAVRPATPAEVTMYLRLLGFVARVDEMTTENERLNWECDSLVKQRDEASQESVSARLRLEELEAELKDLRRS